MSHPRLLPPLVCCVLVSACGEGPSGPATLLLIDAAPVSDIPLSDAPTSDDTARSSDTTTAGDAGSGTTAVTDAALDCPGGPFCPCTTNSECDHGMCFATHAGRRCLPTCLDTCPAAYKCAPGPGSDVQFWCFPRWGLICEPCRFDKDCAYSAKASCVRYGDDGGFCGAACQADSDCPADNACLEVARVQGGTVKQCVATDALVAGKPAKAPSCACGPLATVEELATECWLPNATADGQTIGRCNGVRKCGKTGLGACIGNADDTKKCIETQCEGPDGQPIADGATCDDDEPCTTGDTCVKGTCKAGTWTCECQTNADCPDDGDVCNGVPYCDTDLAKPACKTNPGTVVTCVTAGDTDCAKTVCIKASGQCAKDFSATDHLCEDGKQCTKGDHCNGKGACVAGTDLCPCKSTADCPDDGDVCNGVPYCDKSATDATKWRCVTNPATIKMCSKSGDTACSKNVCDAKDGTCKMTAIPDSEACDDGDKCTGGEACKAGKCEPSAQTCPCAVSADCVAKDDGNKCNGVLYCDAATGQCALNPATVVSCPQTFADACHKDSCDPQTGACVASPIAAGELCDDNQACTVGDVCDTGPDKKFGCVPGTNVCKCAADADCAAQQKDKCVPLFCNKAAGTCQANLAAAQQCDTTKDTGCSKTACDGTTGVCATKPVADATPCEDNDLCTPNSTCKSGACEPGPNVCYCKSDAECAAFDDGNLCNGTRFCDKSDGVCKPNTASVVTCPSANDTACAKNTCQHILDAQNKPTGTKCAIALKPDGEKCKDGVKCAAWTCSSGKCTVHLGKCDDGNQCTDDVCDADKGCTATNNAAACDDGNKCTGPDKCGGGKCAGPGLKEVCGGGDEDCDGSTDEEAAVGCKNRYWDGDDDGWGVASKKKCLCKAWSKYTATQTGDCHDGNGTVKPGQGGWFTAAYTASGGGKSFDYNCNGKAEPYYKDTKPACEGSGIHCKPNRGWKGTSVPACGKAADYLNGCSAGCAPQYIKQTQKCH